MVENCIFYLFKLKLTIRFITLIMQKKKNLESKLLSRLRIKNGKIRISHMYLIV